MSFCIRSNMVHPNLEGPICKLPNCVNSHDEQLPSPFPITKVSKNSCNFSSVKPLKIRQQNHDINILRNSWACPVKLRTTIISQPREFCLKVLENILLNKTSLVWIQLFLFLLIKIIIKNNINYILKPLPSLLISYVSWLSLIFWS
jgi:hypothetical protein